MNFILFPFWVWLLIVLIIILIVLWLLFRSNPESESAQENVDTVASDVTEKDDEPAQVDEPLDDDVDEAEEVTVEPAYEPVPGTIDFVVDDDDDDDDDVEGDDSDDMSAPDEADADENEDDDDDDDIEDVVILDADMSTDAAPTEAAIDVLFDEDESADDAVTDTADATEAAEDAVTESAEAAADVFEADDEVTIAPVEAEDEPVEDNLKIIEGIGPKIESVLKAAGIRTLRKLSLLEVSEIQEILTANNLRLANPETWPLQAQLAADGKTDELEELQGKLKGGRFV